MGKYLNLQNQRFGRLLVLERDYNTNGKTGVYWKCQCDCGKIISCRRDTLTKGSKTSCGCDLAEKNSKAHLKDETGKRYGKLIVLERAGTKNGCATWLCKCDCGNKTIVYGSTLRSGETQSCGCRKYESKNDINEIGNIYGLLTVLEKATKPLSNAKSTHIFWKCKCACGNETIVEGTRLRQGTAQSCGCLSMSAGEQAIKILLDKHQINYKTQYIFPDCCSPLGGHLRFDFMILDQNNKPIQAIEYNGQQHYSPIEYYGGITQFQKQQLYDNIKIDYCKSHNIKLTIIPYTLTNISLSDLELINYVSRPSMD